MPAMLAVLLLGALPAMSREGAPWVTAYYPGYKQGYLAPSNIDFTVVTHLVHFSIRPKADGGLDTIAKGITGGQSSNLVECARTAGCQTLICLGGADSQAEFQGATAPDHCGLFVSNIVDFVSIRGYDGVDIDWEPLSAADGGQYAGFVRQLRDRLKASGRNRLMTAAAVAQPALFAKLQDQFDQINLMTYDMAGPWSADSATWFNSPVFNGGHRFPNGHPAPSTDDLVKKFLRAGVPAGKMAVGIAFYGCCWSGGGGGPAGGFTLPLQPWTSRPVTTAVSYADIMADYYRPELYRWDTNAQAAYLSIEQDGTNGARFISYDDERACRAKVDYMRTHSLGGVSIFELSQGWCARRPAGRRDPLLQAVKQALAQGVMESRKASRARLPEP